MFRSQGPPAPRENLPKMRAALLLVLIVALPASGGPLLRLTLRVPAEVRLGAPIPFTYELRNLSDRPLLVADPTLSPRPTVPPDDWGLLLELQDPEGHRTALRRFDEYAAWVPVRRQHFRELAPGATLEGEGLLGELRGLERWVRHGPGKTEITEAEMAVLPRAPGRCELRATYVNRVGQILEGDTLREVPCWKGTVTAAPASFRILP